MSKDKTHKNLVKFIDKIINKDYKNAHLHLNNAIQGKIKQKIINNNTSIF
tara:strand:+ start:341 stop:490 length:150 start_codon:yes stop_codon:yes gene_type:complete